MTNKASLNSFALNASAAFSSITGVGELIPIEQVVITTALGALIPVEQTVGFIESGTLISLEQIVQLLAQGSGALIPIEQNVASTQSGTLIPLEQNVLDAASNDHLIRTGWDITLTLNGRIIPKEQIHGDLVVSRTESSTSLLDVTLIPVEGTQDTSSLIGQTVTLDVRTDSGTTRVYTGLVDIPEFDILNKKITLRCADRREELIVAQVGPIINTIGSYSDLIFPPDTSDVIQTLDYRLSTTPTSIDFDAYSNLQITPWAAKATADYTLDDTIIYYRDPRVELTSRGRITNKVNINFEYRYERLHHYERDFHWLSPLDSSFSLFLQQGYTMTRRDMVRQAIDSAGWPMKGDITFNEIHPAGWYDGIAWGTTQLTGTTVASRDSAGNLIKDADGNQVYESSITGGTDLTQIFCEGADWTASTRWSQTVTEKYSLSVNAPQSQAQFGTIEQNNAHSATAEYDSSTWEDYIQYNDDSTLTNTYFLDADDNRGSATTAMNVALLRAKNTILNSHRDTRVTIYRSIMPEIGLQHTVELTSTPIQCKGKVFKINHVFNIGTGEAVTELTLVLSKAQGSATDSSLNAPTISTDTVTLGSTTINLGNHFGINPDPDVTAGAELWTGMIGNAFVSGQFYRTTYTEAFVVDTPTIPDSVREERVRHSSGSYDVEIPNDDLTIIF